MKEFLRKAFPHRRDASAKKKGSWHKGFFDSLAEGYELNMLDYLSSGEEF